MAEFPHLPVATDAYLADTTHLDAQEHGAYLLLLITAWRIRGLPHLPNDDKLLARYAKVDPRTWRRIKPTIMAFWDLGEDGFWTQKKLTEMRDLTRKRVEAAKSKAAKRWGDKPLENNEQVDAAALLEPCTADATKTKPTIVGEEAPNGALSETAVPDHSKASSRKTYPEDFEQAWKAYPTDRNMSKSQAMAEWRKLSADDRKLVLPSIPGFLAYCKAHPTYTVLHQRSHRPGAARSKSAGSCPWRYRKLVDLANHPTCGVRGRVARR